MGACWRDDGTGTGMAATTGTLAPLGVPNMSSPFLDDCITFGLFWLLLGLLGEVSNSSITMPGSSLLF